MATQVDSLLPGNPLTKSEEHGHAGGKTAGDDSVEKGAKRTSGSSEGTRLEGGESEQGGHSVKEQSGTQVQGGGGSRAVENVGKGRDFDTPSAHLTDTDTQVEKDGKCNKKDFTVAPPPKVNPWTKKMNAVTVVSVNGQPRHVSGKWCFNL